MFNAQKFTFVFLLFALASTIAFTSCNDDEMGDPDPNETMICDSFLVSINGNDSILFANVFGGTEPFTYSWSEGSTESAINIFAMGTYAVTVTDANGCTSEDSFIVEEEEPVDDCANFNVTIADTLDNNNALLLAYVSSGGTPPFSYLWTDNSTSPTLEVTESGTYGVSITDSNGCVDFAEFYFSNSPCDGFFVDIDVSPDTLDNNGYILNAYPNGGTAPFNYTWNQGSTEPILYQVTTGTYAVTVADANGCTTEDEVVVE